LTSARKALCREPQASKAPSAPSQPTIAVCTVSPPGMALIRPITAPSGK
jgi:hypothetical protein